MTLENLAVELSSVAEGVIAADGDQVIEIERLDVLEDRLGDVKGGGSDAPLGGFLKEKGKLLALEQGRELLHFRWIGARTVEIGAAGAVDGASILAVQSCT